MSDQSVLRQESVGKEASFTRRRDRDKLRAMKATLPEPEIVTRKGKPVSVIIPIKDYEELLERIEDSDDVAWLKRVRKKPMHYRPLEDYLAERNRK
jgi:PHD/YefM family antitoxin component YafN of YafNO toxin-antitoxin module